MCRIGYICATRKLIYIVESRRGVLQGDPLANAAFTRAYTGVLNRVRGKFKDVIIIGIADDTYFIGAFDEVLKAWNLAVALAEILLGLTFRPDKSAATARDLSQLSAVQLAQLAAAGVPYIDGFEVAGTPLGTSPYISSKLDTVVADIRDKAASIATVCASNVNTVQALFTTATLGLASMITHLLRTLPPELTARHAREVDVIAVDCARNVLGLQHVLGDSEAGRDMRERLFMQLGGMGMMSCEKVADAAYIGHWGLVGPAVQAMLPGILFTNAATLQLSPLVALQAATARVSAEATASEVKLVVDDLPRLLSNKVRGLQGVISHHLADLRHVRYVKSMPVTTAGEKARKRAFVSGASREAGAALHASRRHRGNEPPQRRRVPSRVR